MKWIPFLNNCIKSLMQDLRWCSSLTRQAEPEGFSHFHLYVCAAFLVRWRKEILEERDFQVMHTWQYTVQPLKCLFLGSWQPPRGVGDQSMSKVPSFNNSIFVFFVYCGKNRRDFNIRGTPGASAIIMMMSSLWSTVRSRIIMGQKGHAGCFSIRQLTADLI